MTRATLLITLLASTGCVAPAGDRAVGNLSEAATVCAAGATVTGIDVSHYQGTVDWAQVAASGRKFGIAKATEGTGYTDSSFAANWAAMKNAGVLRSAYHFFRSNLDATAQAQYFVNAVGALGAGDLPLMLDLETTDGQSGSTVASKALVFLQKVEQLTGKKPIVYTYPDFWQNQIGAPSGFTGYPLNIANYGVTCPNVVGSWATWTMWQNSSTGSVSGVSGQVDEDVFNGDLAALMNFAGGSGGGGGGGGGGTPNPCVGLSDGSYCGGDGLTGDKNTLYVCAGGNVSSMKVCAGGCKYNPPGTPDACNPDPPMPDGGAGGGGGGGGGGTDDGGVGGGGSGGNGGVGSGGGGSGGGSGGMPSGGCSMAGSSANDGAAALVLTLIGLVAFAFAFALRRRVRS